MKYEYIGEQSITLHGNGEAGARMSEIELPTDAEGQDLGWHALNYRTAHTMHAQAMYEELERYVRGAIAAERRAALDVVAALAKESRDREERDIIGKCWDAINRGSAAIRRG